ncbi:putative UPF0481 protein [Tanacetum coccineum]
MASLNPSLSPNIGNKPWVDQISKTLQTQLAVTIDTPPVSIYEVPKIIKTEKPEAYVPRRIGLGPNHHFQPELYKKMEQKKLIAVRRVLKLHQIHDYKQQVVEKVKQIIPAICACYDSYPDSDDETLAWVFAIDGIFLIDELNTYSKCGLAIEANDLVKLENQIPLIVLKEIHKALLGESAQTQDDHLEFKLRVFCESHSPIGISNVKTNFGHANHLLDYMYHSIVNNETLTLRKVEFTNLASSDPVKKDMKLELVGAIMKVAELIPGAIPLIRIVESISQLFAESGGPVEELIVPTASELWKTARVKFRLSPINEGIMNIKFVNGKDRVCYLPRITLDRNSEVVLRNLVAYEKLMVKNDTTFASEYGLDLTGYVDFMSGIIDTVKDVKILREGKVIESDLADEEIAELFNGMRKTRGKVSVETEMMKIVAQLNQVYESTPIVWCQNLIEKQLRAWSKIITVTISILTTLFLFHQGGVKLYGQNPPHMILIRNLQSKLSPLLVFFIRPKGPVV